jgi:hypothetical protein
MGKTESKRYRELASQKHELAQSASDPNLKREYVELVDAYEKLAEQAARIEVLMKEARPRARNPIGISGMRNDQPSDAVATAIAALQAAGYKVEASDTPGHWTVSGTITFTEREMIRAARQLGRKPSN